MGDHDVSPTSSRRGAGRTFVSAASAATVNYTARLSGRAEIPKNDSKGKGKLDATFDPQSKVFTYTLTFDGSDRSRYGGPHPRSGEP